PSIRRPPSPTLFPYTTLFRSDQHLVAHRFPVQRLPSIAVRGLGPRQASTSISVFLKGQRVSEVGASGGFTTDVVVIGGCGRVGLDRKSTRLNSSHVAISYAVF